MGPFRPEITGWHKQTDRHTRDRLVLLFQLFATVVVLGWLPGNVIKFTAMVMVWGIGFRRISRRELITMAGVNVLFSLMDMAALHAGVFRFQHPDLLGLPVYEFFLWGFYTLHALRFVGRAPAKPRLFPAAILAVLFVIPFATITDFRVAIFGIEHPAYF